MSVGPECWRSVFAAPLPMVEEEAPGLSEPIRVSSIQQYDKSDFTIKSRRYEHTETGRKYVKVKMPITMLATIQHLPEMCVDHVAYIMPTKPEKRNKLTSVTCLVPYRPTGKRFITYLQKIANASVSDSESVGSSDTTDDGDNDSDMGTTSETLSARDAELLTLRGNKTLETSIFREFKALLYQVLCISHLMKLYGVSMGDDLSPFDVDQEKVVKFDLMSTVDKELSEDFEPCRGAENRPYWFSSLISQLNMVAYNFHGDEFVQWLDMCKESYTDVSREFSFNDIIQHSFFANDQSLETIRQAYISSISGHHQLQLTDTNMTVYKPKHVAILFNWIFEVCESLKIETSTYWYFVALFDRVIKYAPPPPATHLQMLGCAVLFLSLTMLAGDETVSPTVDRLITTGAVSIPKGRLIFEKMWMRVLVSLGGQLLVKKPYIQPELYRQLTVKRTAELTLDYLNNLGEKINPDDIPILLESVEPIDFDYHILDNIDDVLTTLVRILNNQDFRPESLESLAKYIPHHIHKKIMAKKRDGCLGKGGMASCVIKLDETSVLKISDPCGVLVSNFCDELAQDPVNYSGKLIISNFLAEGIIGGIMKSLEDYSPHLSTADGVWIYKQNQDSDKAKAFVKMPMLKSLDANTFSRPDKIMTLFQVAQALEVAQQLMWFTHNDLHLGNVLFAEAQPDHDYTYPLPDGRRVSMRPKYLAKISDYGYSTLTFLEKRLITSSQPYTLADTAFDPYKDFDRLLYIFNYDDSGRQLQDIYDYVFLAKFIYREKWRNVRNIHEIVQFLAEKLVEMNLASFIDEQTVATTASHTHYTRLDAYTRLSSPVYSVYTDYSAILDIKVGDPNKLLTLHRNYHQIKQALSQGHDLVELQIHRITDQLTAVDYVYFDELTAANSPNRKNTRYGSALNDFTHTFDEAPFHIIHVVYIDQDQEASATALSPESPFSYNFECCRVDVTEYLQNHSGVAINGSFFRLTETDQYPVGDYRGDGDVRPSSPPEKYAREFRQLYIDGYGKLRINPHEKIIPTSQYLTSAPLLIKDEEILMTRDYIFETDGKGRYLHQCSLDKHRPKTMPSCDEIVPGELTHAGNQNPRSAVAEMKDGRMAFIYAEGRLESGAGLDLLTFAQILSTLGAVTALNLDGGRSSALAWRHPEEYHITSANYRHTLEYPVGNIIAFSAPAPNIRDNPNLNPLLSDQQVLPSTISTVDLDSDTLPGERLAFIDGRCYLANIDKSTGEERLTHYVNADPSDEDSDVLTVTEFTDKTVLNLNYYTPVENPSEITHENKIVTSLGDHSYKVPLPFRQVTPLTTKGKKGKEPETESYTESVYSESES